MQGTISILFGCHSPFHSVLVLIAWIKLYKEWPKFWQIICIFLHDIGHIGLNYLDDYDQKKKHWILGAKIGRFLFGDKAFYFLAGHDKTSGYELSRLYKADKYSWYIAPYWWLYKNAIVEPKLRKDKTIKEHVGYFMEQVKNNIESGKYNSTHELYLDGNND